MTKTSAGSEEVVRAAEAWLADDPDPATRQELRQVLDGLPGTYADLAERFAAPLSFGTAGLRGPVRAGPAGMNRAVVRAAAAGLAGYLHEHHLDGPVVIGYDARRGSAEFAGETAAVVAGAGRSALVLPGPLPTPVLAYAVRALGAAAGVMVTASHNPAADNGYKVYLGNGAQIIPPADREIEARIRTVGRLAAVPLGSGGVLVDQRLVDGYVAALVEAVADRSPAVRPEALRIAYTPLHGVGRELMLRALDAAGFAPPAVVATQAEPDPAFPTVPYPNPEEPGATDALLALAIATDADIAIANDPDADRCAVAVPDPDTDGGWRLLTGDELGVLLADQLLRRGVQGIYATTIVSSSLLGKLAASRGAEFAETLTGFKWIMRAGDGPMAFGYEEALGYAVTPALVRDKDGIGAALAIAGMAASAKADGGTLLDRLDALAAEFGSHATGQLAVRVEDVAQIDAAMARLRAAPPAQLVGRPVSALEDLLPTANVVTLRADGVRVVVRPSGTEPKLKAYLEVVEPGEPAAARRSARDLLAELRTETATALGLG